MRLKQNAVVRILARTSFLALGFSLTSIAHAQSAPPSQDTAAPSGDVLGEDIVVTAQRTQERLQDVPIAITAFSGKAMEALGMRDAKSLESQTPGLRINGAWTSATPTVFLRGVGDNNFNANNVSAVGFYFDDVYVGSSVGINQLLLDLDRVEILKGPQGTLYGRNTTGGAINFIARQPDIGGDVSADGYASVGTSALFEGKVGANIPLSDRAAARLSLTALSDGGPFRNSLTGRRGRDIESYAGRLLIAVEPAEGFKATFGIRASHSTSGVTNKSAGVADPDTFAPCAPEQIMLGGPCVDFSGYRPSVAFKTEDEGTRSRDRVRTFGASAKLVWDIGDYTLTSVTGYDENDRVLREDLDHLPADFLNNDWRSNTHQISQEIRVNSPASGRFRWTLGAFGIREKLDSFSAYASYTFPGLFTGSADNEAALQNIRQTTKSYAGFAQAYFDITDRLTLTLGGRYTYESKKFLLTSDAVGLGAAPGSTVIGRDYAAASDLGRLILQDDFNSWKSGSGRVALDYKITPDVMLFGSISLGTKAGGYNGGALVQQSEIAVVDPEKLLAYEVGIKSEFLDRALRLNASVFNYEYRDQQVFVLRSVGGFITTNLENAGRSRVRGVDIDIVFRPDDRLTLKASGSYLDTQINRFDGGPGAIDFTGNRLPKAPKWSGSGLVQYDVPLANQGLLTLQADVSLASKVFFDLSNNPVLSQGGYALVGSRISYRLPNERLTLSAWVKNLFDKHYVVDGFDNASLGWYTFPVGNLRSAGVTASFSF